MIVLLRHIHASAQLTIANHDPKKLFYFTRTLRERFNPDLVPAHLFTTERTGRRKKENGNLAA